MRGAARMLDPPVQRPPVSSRLDIRESRPKHKQLLRTFVPRQVRKLHALSPRLDEKKK